MSGIIDLPLLVGLVDGVYIFVEEIDDLLQLGNRTIVVGVGHKDDALLMRVLRDFEGAITTTLGQVIGPLRVAILVDQAFLDNVGARIRQRIQEVGGLLVGDNDDCAGIRRRDAIPDDRLDLARY